MYPWACIHAHLTPLTPRASRVVVVCQFIEHMLTHPEKAPISKLREPCHHCLSTIHEELRSLGGQVAAKSRLARFPKLQAKVREEVEKLLGFVHDEARKEVEKVISMEEAYIYTDSGDFERELGSAIKTLVTALDPQLLRSILSSYYKTVVVHAVSNAVPKAIMLHYVHAFGQSINKALFESLGGMSHEGLLDEPPEVDMERRADENLLARLKAAKDTLERIR